jgi:hypothetical protein
MTVLGVGHINLRTPPSPPNRALSRKGFPLHWQTSTVTIDNRICGNLFFSAVALLRRTDAVFGRIGWDVGYVRTRLVAYGGGLLRDTQV